MRPRRFNPLSVFLLLCLFCLMANAQYSAEYTTYKSLYPDARSVRLLQETTIKIGMKSDDINISQEFIEEDLYLDDGATYGSKRALRFSAFFELEEVEAFALNFEDDKYREAKVENYSTKDEMEESFHDDMKSLNFIFPNLKKGSISKLKYSEIVKNPRFLSTFYFGDFSPIIKNKVSIVADKDITLRFLEFNTEGLDISFSKNEKGGNIIYTWELNNVDEFDFESGVPSYKTVLPHIIPVISAYKQKGETVNLLEDVSDLYDWYFSLIKDVNTQEIDAKLVELVNEITADKATDFEKVKAIYYWTQQNIKYIAFEYALGGFVPREANDVFKKKYGDCKDNSSILHEMLKIAGLKGNITWIGTRKIPYSYREVPTPVVDNHMILAYTYEDTIYYLDATGRYLPMELPSSFIQGKEALISKGEGRFEIEKVPVVPAKTNALIDTTYINLEGNSILGTSKVELFGYKKVDIFNRLEILNTDSKAKEFYNASFQKGSNKFLISSYSETNKYMYDENFSIDFSFKINDYVKSSSNEIYVNLNLNREFSRFRTEDNRKYEREFEYKDHYEYVTFLSIPEGYTVDYLPENVSLQNKLAEVATSYEIKEQQIIYKHSLTLNFLTLNTDEQKEVNNLIKQSEKSYKELIILKKI